MSRELANTPAENTVRQMSHYMKLGIYASRSRDSKCDSPIATMSRKLANAPDINYVRQMNHYMKLGTNASRSREQM